MHLHWSRHAGNLGDGVDGKIAGALSGLVVLLMLFAKLHGNDGLVVKIGQASARAQDAGIQSGLGNLFNFAPLLVGRSDP